MNGSNGTTLLVATVCAVSISLAFQYCGNFKSQPAKKVVDEAQYKLYLDQMWLRINRAWGIPERKLNTKHMKVMFDLDKTGKATHASVENSKDDDAKLEERLLSTIEAASPFPQLANLPEHVQVRCDVEVRDGSLYLVLKIPEVEIANGFKSSVVERLSEQERLKAMPGIMRGTNQKAKEEALEELKNMASGSASCTEALCLALKDKDKEIRYRAFQTVADIGSDALGTLPVLLKIVNGTDESARVNAVEAIGSLGPGAKAAIPALLATLHERGSTFHMSLHLEATRALRKIAPSTNKKALEILLPSMDAAEFFTWEEDTFVEFGADAVPYLLNAVNKMDNNIRFINAAKVLAKMGDAAIPAVPGLAAACRSSNEEVGENAAAAIESLGPKARAAVPDLLYVLQHPVLDSNGNIVDALGAIGRAAKPAIPVLQELARKDPSNADRINDAIRNISHAEE